MNSCEDSTMERGLKYTNVGQAAAGILAEDDSFSG